MDFMNEIINPPCNRLLTTFFDFNFEICQKRASTCLRTSVHSKRTLSQLLELLFSVPLLMPPEEQVAREGEREREARRVWWDVQRDHLKKTMFAGQRLAPRQMRKTRTVMLLVALRRLDSLCTSLRVSRSENISWKKTCREEYVWGTSWICIWDEV